MRAEAQRATRRRSPALGRFAHEAVVDRPAHAAIVYLTEDAERRRTARLPLHRRTTPRGATARCGAGGHAGRRCAAPTAATFVPDLSVYASRARRSTSGWVPVPDPLARDGVDPQAARRQRGHPQPQVRGRLVGRRQRVHRVLLRPRRATARCGEHDGQVWRLRPGGRDADARGRTSRVNPDPASGPTPTAPTTSPSRRGAG